MPAYESRMSNSSKLQVRLPPLVGHFAVPGKRHWLGVLAASLMAGACGGLVSFGLFVYLHFYTGGVVSLSDGFWIGWFTAVIFALVAAPLLAISFSLARAILTRFGANSGLVYVGIGLVVGIAFGRAGTPNPLQSVLGELGGFAAGLAYWAVANRDAVVASHDSDGLEPIASQTLTSAAD